MLENLSGRLTGIFDRLRGRGHLREEDIDACLREVRIALLEADVNFKVVKEFIAHVRERCMDADVLESLTPAQNVFRIVLDETTDLLGTTSVGLKLSGRIPGVIMLVGLQGSGKTTACAKLAYKLSGEGHRPLLAACDIYRPAAADQLATLGAEIGVKVFREDGKDPVDIAKDSIRAAIDGLNDVVIIDTAGRLHVDDAMMNEAARIKDATSPDEVLMVLDATTGQDVVNVVSAFAEKVDFDGVILSKMDGDARGGGALSLREVTGKPIKFFSAGEKMDSLEVFYPDRLAKRILGLGDVATLIESAVKVKQEEDAAEAAEEERLASGNISLNDFIMINRQVKGMGGVNKLISALPGGDRMRSQGQVDEGALDRMEVIINSMTASEREKPEILNASRRQRIARGAGVTVTDVNGVIKQFNETRQMLKKMTSALSQMSGGRKTRKSRGKKRRNRAIPGLGNLRPSDIARLQQMMNQQ